MHGSWLLVSLTMAGPAAAMTPEDCTFYAPFDGAFEAAEARGSAQAEVKGEIAFVPGMRGQGILVGGPETGLSYQASGNLNLDAGTVSVWVKPEGWDDRDAAMRFFFGWSEGQPAPPQDGGQFLWLYRFFAQSTYLLAWDSRGFPTVCRQDPKQFPDVFRPGEWVHLVGTWNGDELRLFINGQPQGASRVPTLSVLRSPGERFTVGDPNRANAADTVLDELRLFSRALTAPEVKALHAFTLEAPPEQQELTVVRLPGAGKIRVDVNACGHRPDEAGALSARVRVQPRDGAEVLVEQTAAFREMPHVAVDLDAQGLAVGDYRVISELSAGGTLLATTEAPLAVHAPPAWLGSQTGLTDKVLDPWTPLVVRAEEGAVAVECWGRRHGFGRGQLLPAELVTAGTSVLAAPITLTAQVGEQALEWGPSRVALAKQSPARVELRAEAAAGDVQATTESALEFDGLLWTRLSLRSSGPLLVDRLTVEIPLRSEAATLMQTGFGHDEAGRVRAWSHRVVANSQVWLGDENGGLQCTVPSARNWRNVDHNRQLEIVAQGDRVLLRLNLVDRPTTFETGVEYEFGLQLTPVRPKPPGWRLWRITPLDDTPGARFSPFYTEGWAQGTSYPIPRPEWRRIFDEETAKGNLATIYLQPYCVWPGMPDYPDFAAEWRGSLANVPPPFDPQAPPMSGMGVCPRPHSWSDYFVTTFCDLYEGPYQDMGWGAVYFDVTPPPSCDNADHGCGYRDEYGVRQPEQRYLEHREVQRRFYTALQERWPEKVLVNHESGCLNMIQLAFCHGMVDGEHLTLALPPADFSYRDLLTLDRMRAEYMGHNFGFVPIFLPEFTRAAEGNDEVANRFMLTEEPPEVMHLLGLLALHDILPWNAYSNPTPYFHWWAVQDAFGWGDEVEFLPYWSNGKQIGLAPEDPNLVCTIYRRPGKLLFVVMNNTDEDLEVSLAPDWAGLGVAAPAAGLLDAWEGASFRCQGWEADPATGKARRSLEPVQVTGTEVRVPLTDGRGTLPVGKRSFRMLVTS